MNRCPSESPLSRFRVWTQEGDCWIAGSLCVRESEDPPQCFPTAAVTPAVTPRGPHTPASTRHVLRLFLSVSLTTATRVGAPLPRVHARLTSVGLGVILGADARGPRWPRVALGLGRSLVRAPPCSRGRRGLGRPNASAKPQGTEFETPPKAMKPRYADTSLVCKSSIDFFFSVSSYSKSGFKSCESCGGK